MKPRGPALAGMVAVLLAAMAAAQPHPSFERGFDPAKAYQFGDIDSVNLLNGNLIITIPIGPTYPVSERLSYHLNLVYNSKVWDTLEVGTCGVPQPAWHSNAGVGWRLSLGTLLAPTDPKNDITNNHLIGTTSNGWEYIGADGAEHRFYSTLHEGETPDANGYYSYTRDGSYLRMAYMSPMQRSIEFPDGTIHTFETTTWPDGLSDWRIIGISDRFDDRPNGLPNILIQYPTATTMTISDEFNRTQTITFMADPNNWYTRLVQRVDLTAFSGTTASYTFNYSLTATVSVPVRKGDCLNNPAQYSVPELTSVTLPDGTSRWTLQTDGDAELASLQLPTGGTIAYTYQGWLLPAQACTHLKWQYESHAVATRTFHDVDGTNNGAWTYTEKSLGYSSPGTPQLECDTNDIEQAPQEELQVLLTSPLGHQSVHYFSVFPGWSGNLSITDPKGPYAGPFVPEEYGLPLSRMRAPDSGPGSPRFLSVDQYNCPNATCPASPTRQAFARYELDGGVSCGAGTTFGPDCMNSNHRLAAERTLYLDDPQGGAPSCSGYTLVSGAWSDTTCRSATTDYSTFDGLGHYRTATTGGTFDSGNQRTTTTDYNPSSGTYPGSFTPWPTSSPWVLNTYDYQQATENSVTAATEYCFDPNTGYLNRKRALSSGTSEGANDLITTFTPDAAGNTTSERYFGGDTQAISIGVLCGLQLPSQYQYRIDHTNQDGVRATSQYVDPSGNPATFFSLYHQIDASTGLVSASSDSAGLSTAFTYDNMGRLTRVQPQTSFNGGAWVRNAYTDASGTTPARVNLYAYANGTTSNPLAQEEYTFDGFGRVAKVRQLLALGGWNQRLFQYNAQGWKTFVSEAQPDGTTGSALSNTQYQNYDSFGRVGLITPPDGAAHNITMTYVGVRLSTRQVSIAASASSESPVSTGETYDRQGRLAAVQENANPLPSTSAVTTTYAYDVGNRLSSVTMNGQQTRTFTYDNRGFILFADIPEKTIPTGRSGACANHDVCYSNYDARGHTGRVQDGANDLTLTTNWKEQLTDVYVTGSSAPHLKAFTFATSSTSGDWANGKLRSATMIAPANDGVVTTTESFIYGGVGGAVSQKTTQVSLSGSSEGDFAQQTFTEGYTWTDLGKLASLTYPAAPGVAPARTVYDSYTNGYLTAVGPEYANSITYYANNVLASVVHANGITDTQTIADGQNNRPSDWMARPISIGAVNGGTSIWSTGTYAYDGTGNIKTMNTGGFVYYPFSRLASASMTVSGTGHSQAYAYDPYGNMTSVATDGGTPVNFTITGLTNRLDPTSGYGYDDAGNATQWAAGGNTYTASYDPVDKMASMTGLGTNSLYAYDADGERIMVRDRNASPTVYTISLRDLNAKVIRQLTYAPSTSAWSWSKDYVYGNGALLASVDANKGVHHYTLDHFGTPRLVSDRCGQQYALFNYFPFGDEVVQGNQDGTEKERFTGHERDLGMLDHTNDDIDYMHARYYKPVSAERFFSVDLGEPNPHMPQTWNRYTYAVNNPLRLADPTGLAINDVTSNSTASQTSGELGSPAGSRPAQVNQAARAQSVPPALRAGLVLALHQAELRDQAAAGNEMAIHELGLRMPMETDATGDIINVVVFALTLGGSSAVGPATGGVAMSSGLEQLPRRPLPRLR